MCVVLQQTTIELHYEQVLYFIIKHCEQEFINNSQKNCIECTYKNLLSKIKNNKRTEILIKPHSEQLHETRRLQNLVSSNSTFCTHLLHVLWTSIIFRCWCCLHWKEFQHWTVNKYFLRHFFIHTVSFICVSSESWMNTWFLHCIEIRAMITLP